MKNMSGLWKMVAQILRIELGLLNTLEVMNILIYTKTKKGEK